MDKRESSAGRIADQSGSNQAPSSLHRLSQKKSRTIAFSNVTLPHTFGRADRGGDNLFLDILCGNMEPISLRRDKILAPGSLQSDLPGNGRQLVGCNSLFTGEPNVAPFE